MGLDGGRYVVNTGFDKHEQGMVKKGWGIVERNISRVTSLVLDILHFAKDREPDWALVDLSQLIREVTDLFGAKFRKREITLDLSLRPVEPFQATEKGMHSMLVSLLENAVDACVWDVEQEEHRILIHLHEEENEVVLTILDDGIGMDDETLARIFTPMFSTKRGGGTGLGLLVAEKVVKEHSGTIDVTSEPGKGSVFTIRLPAGRDI
jgi:signal transduction histidine kinase